jgi:hypothetical protein
MPMNPSRPFLAHSPTVASDRKSVAFVLSPPFVHGRPTLLPVAEAAPVDEPKPEAVPSNEVFVDRIPMITEFAPDEMIEEPQPVTATESAPSDWPTWGEPEAEPVGGDEWGTTEWQQFDWTSASSLGSEAPADRAAADAWAGTDWSNPRDPVGSAQSAAEALAQALEQISQRIRAGELSVPGTDRVKDDAAIAATLATLLGIKR